MDHQLEQETELESLGYIFPEELTIISQTPIKFTISVQDSEPPFTMDFTFPDTYPETIPMINLQGLDIDIIPELQDYANGLLGMGMVFNLVSFAKDTLEQRSLLEKEQMERARLEKQRLEEEEEKKKSMGTRVTKESFLEWKNNFILEAVRRYKAGDKLNTSMEAAAMVELGRKREKATGKELFEKDLTLYLSDMQYTDEQEVTVDASLFEKLQGLDLDEEDELNVDLTE